MKVWKDLHSFVRVSTTIRYKFVKSENNAAHTLMLMLMRPIYYHAVVKSYRMEGELTVHTDTGLGLSIL